MEKRRQNAESFEIEKSDPVTRVVVTTRDVKNPKPNEESNALFGESNALFDQSVIPAGTMLLLTTWKESVTVNLKIDGVSVQKVFPAKRKGTIRVHPESQTHWRDGHYEITDDHPLYDRLDRNCMERSKTSIDRLNEIFPAPDHDREFYVRLVGRLVDMAIVTMEQLPIIAKDLK